VHGLAGRRAAAGDNATGRSVTAPEVAAMLPGVIGSLA